MYHSGQEKCTKIMIAIKAYDKIMEISHSKYKVPKAKPIDTRVLFLTILKMEAKRNIEQIR